MVNINAVGLHYRLLNEHIRAEVDKGAKEIVLKGINGHRYIGDGIRGNVKIVVEGVPGNDLGAFMDGPTIIVKANGQDAIGNTMNEGKIIVHGHAGDVIGYGMRGGRIFIMGDVGYRVGIHMKAFKDKKPIIVVGGNAQDFLGEYMAGGVVVVLGLKENRDSIFRIQRTGLKAFGENLNHIPIVGNFVGTGMHGGTMFIRGRVEPYQVGKEVGVTRPDKEDEKFLKEILKEYCSDFSLDINELFKTAFIKLFPQSSRPYGKLYAY